MQSPVPDPVISEVIEERKAVGGTLEMKLVDREGENGC